MTGVAQGLASVVLRRKSLVLAAIAEPTDAPQFVPPAVPFARPPDVAPALSDGTARTRVWLAIGGALLAALAAIRIAVLVTGHVPMGHDTFQYLQLQYLVYSNA